MSSRTSSASKSLSFAEIAFIASRDWECRISTHHAANALTLRIVLLRPVSKLAKRLFQIGRNRQWPSAGAPLSAVSARELRRCKRASGLSRFAVRKVQIALEAAGVEFLNCGQPGVQRRSLGAGVLCHLMLLVGVSA